MEEVRFNNAFSSSQPSSGYSQRVSEEEWSKHESLIRHLHSTQSTKKEIAAVLESQHGFCPSDGQLGRQMKKWDLVVYNTQSKQNIVSSEALRELASWIESSPSMPAAFKFLELTATLAACHRRFNFAFILYECMYKVTCKSQRQRHFPDDPEIITSSVINCLQVANDSIQRRRALQYLRESLLFFDTRIINASVANMMYFHRHQQHIRVDSTDCNSNCLRPSLYLTYFTIYGLPLPTTFQCDAYNLRTYFQEHTDVCVKEHGSSHQTMDAKPFVSDLKLRCLIEFEVCKKALVACIESLESQILQRYLDPKPEDSKWPCDNRTPEATTACTCYQDIHRHLLESLEAILITRALQFRILLDDCLIELPTAFIAGVLSDILVQYEEQAFEYVYILRTGLRWRTGRLYVDLADYLFEDSESLCKVIRRAITNAIDHNISFRQSHGINDVELGSWVYNLRRTIPTSSETAHVGVGVEVVPSTNLLIRKGHRAAKTHSDVAVALMFPSVLEGTEPVGNFSNIVANFGPLTEVSGDDDENEDDNINDLSTFPLLPSTGPPSRDEPLRGGVAMPTNVENAWISSTSLFENRHIEFDQMREMKGPSSPKPGSLIDHDPILSLTTTQQRSVIIRQDSREFQAQPPRSLNSVVSETVPARSSNGPAMVQDPLLSATSSLRSFMAVARRVESGSKVSLNSDMRMSDSMSTVSRISGASSWSFKPFIRGRSSRVSSEMSLG